MQGFEVDYIVHVATCIGHSPESGRAGVTFALRTMGMSVVSGYTTTVGAALFLLPCEMGVFTQFGMLRSIRSLCATATYMLRDRSAIGLYHLHTPACGKSYDLHR